MAEPWVHSLTAQLHTVKSTQVAPFAEMVKAYGHVRSQLATSNSGNQRLQKQVDDLSSERASLIEEVSKLQLATKGIVVKSNKERELEERNTALNEQIKNALSQMSEFLVMQQRLKEITAENINLTGRKFTLEQQVKKLTNDAEEREKVVSLLKQEVGALQTENQIQRDNFEATKSENERLLPMIMKSKEREADLMQQILDLETQVANFVRGDIPGLDASGHSVGGPPLRSQIFTTETATSGLSGCIMPSYIAHQTDAIHEGDVHALAMTETGRHIWTGGTDKCIKCWDATNGQAINKVNSYAAVLSLDSSSDVLVCGCVDAICRVWELGTMRGRCQLTGHTEKVTASYLSVDATKVFTASSDRTIKSWDLARGSLEHTIMCYSAVHDLAVANDRVCSAHYDATIRFYDARSGKECGEIPKAHEKAVTSVRFTRDGNQVVSLARDNTVRVFDTRMMKMVNTLTSPQLSISSNLTRLTLSPDNQFCAVGVASGSVLVWPMREGGTAKALEKGHKGSVPCVFWSPDGRGLASIGADRSLVFWR